MLINELIDKNIHPITGFIYYAKVQTRYGNNEKKRARDKIYRAKKRLENAKQTKED